MTDPEILEALKRIDASDADVDDFEADLLESLLTRRYWSDKQRAAALRMVEKYEGEES